jgi:hypothetical protein
MGERKGGHRRGTEERLEDHGDYEGCWIENYICYGGSTE